MNPSKWNKKWINKHVISFCFSSNFVDMLFYDCLIHLFRFAVRFGETICLLNVRCELSWQLWIEYVAYKKYPHTKNVYWKLEDIVFVFVLLCISFSLKELSNIEFAVLFSHKSFSSELNLCVHFWLSKLRSIHVRRTKGVESVKIVESVWNERRSVSDIDSNKQ